MKTKLLKKVRKRYSIELVTKAYFIDYQNSYSMHERVEVHKKPTYLLLDNELGHISRWFQNTEDAYGCLMYWIKEDYGKIIKKKSFKSTKVWYNEKTT